MPKGDAYACDAGCGASLMLTGGDTLMRNGWYHTFTPQGQPTVYACSARCNRIVAARLEATEAPNQIGAQR